MSSEVKRYSVVLHVANDSPFRQTGDSCTRPIRTDVVLATDYAALEAECERWKERCQYNADTAHAVAAERDALAAELAAIKGQEPVGVVHLRKGGGISMLQVELNTPLHHGTKLYTLPSASRVQEGT